MRPPVCKHAASRWQGKSPAGLLDCYEVSEDWEQRTTHAPLLLLLHSRKEPGQAIAYKVQHTNCVFKWIDQQNVITNHSPFWTDSLAGGLVRLTLGFETSQLIPTNAAWQQWIWKWIKQLHPHNHLGGGKQKTRILLVSQVLWAHGKAELQLHLSYRSLSAQGLPAWWEAKCCPLHVINTLAQRCHTIHSHERLSLLQQPLPSLPSIQRPTRTPVIDVQMDAVPKVSPNLGQTLVQDKDQWLPWPVTKPGRQEGKASKLQLERARLLGDRCAQIHSQINNNGFQQNKTKIPRGYCSSLAVTKCT